MLALDSLAHWASFRPDFLVKDCVPWTESRLQQVEIALNVYFLLIWLMRFLDYFYEAQHYVLHEYSIVFFLVVPPSFVSVVLKRTWSGMLESIEYI